MKMKRNATEPSAVHPILGVGDLIDTSISPWFAEVEYVDYRSSGGLRVLCSDPEKGDGWADSGEPLVGRFLRPNRVVRAFQEARTDGKLCCAKSMDEDGYWAGCALDADVVLQYACYRGVKFA